MDRYSKAISGVRKWSRLLDAHADGHKPAEIIEACRTLLLGVVEDSSAVDDLRPDHLIAEAINIQRIFEDPWSTEQFWFSLELHRHAYAIDRQASLNECARWEPQISRGLSHYWSAVQLEQPKDLLAIDDFAAECFRNIGSLLEATTQPLLRELLGQARIICNADRNNIDQIDFGNVISELATTNESNLFAPLPWSLSLSQWRNIAQHLSFEIINNLIKIRYGKGLKLRELELSREDLWHLVLVIFRIQLIVKTARTIFVLDHAAELHGLMESYPERPDALIFGFATIAASQGFDVIEVKVQPEHARAVLRDVTEMNPYERQFHASQFVQNLWAATGALECELEYQQKDGTPTLITLASAADCKAVGDEQIDVGEFIRRVTFKPLIENELTTETEGNPSDA